MESQTVFTDWNLGRWQYGSDTTFELMKISTIQLQVYIHPMNTLKDNNNWRSADFACQFDD